MNLGTMTRDRFHFQPLYLILGAVILVHLLFFAYALIQKPLVTGRPGIPPGIG